MYSLFDKLIKIKGISFGKCIYQQDDRGANYFDKIFSSVGLFLSV